MAKPRKKTDYDRLHDYEYKIRHYTKQQKKKRKKESEGKMTKNDQFLVETRYADEPQRDNQVFMNRDQIMNLLKPSLAKYVTHDDFVSMILVIGLQETKIKPV